MLVDKNKKYFNIYFLGFLLLLKFFDVWFFGFFFMYKLICMCMRACVCVCACTYVCLGGRGWGCDVVGKRSKE